MTAQPHTIRREGSRAVAAPSALRNRDLTLDECRAIAKPVSHGPFGSHTSEEIARAIYGFAGPLNGRVAK